MSGNSFTKTSLHAAAKGQYYPTPIEVIDYISEMLIEETPNHTIRNLERERVTRIFDPSCGKGAAVLRLARNLGGVAYGNELARSRWEVAVDAFGMKQVTLGPAESVSLKYFSYPKHTSLFDIVFNNPPYDMAGDDTRLECEHTRIALDMVSPDGYLINVIPAHILKRMDFWEAVYRHSKESCIYKFPDGELWDRFHQVVVIIKKTRYTNYSHMADARARYNWAESFGDFSELTSLDEAAGSERFKYRLNSGDIELENSMPNAGEITSAIEGMGDILESPGFLKLTTPSVDNSIVQRPAMPVSSTQLAQLSGAGMLNGQRVTIDGIEYLLSGGSYKKLEIIETSEGDGGAKSVDKVRKIESMAYRIFGIAETGRTIALDSSVRGVQFNQFLVDYMPELLNAVREAYPPWYTMDYSEYESDLALIESPRKSLLPGQKNSGLITAQVHVVAAMLGALSRLNVVLVNGEVGTGKTCMALAIQAIKSGMFSGKHAKLVVFVPPTTATDKWAREAPLVLRNVPGLKVFVIGQSKKQAVIVNRQGDNERAKIFGDHKVSGDRVTFLDNDGCQVDMGEKKNGSYKRARAINDIREAMAHEGPAVIVLPYSVGKLGSPWEVAVSYKRRRIQWVEYKDVENKYSRGTHQVKVDHDEILEVPCCPNCGEGLVSEETGQPWTVGTRKDNELNNKVKEYCPKCGSSLWQCKPFSYGGRWPVAEYLNQYHAGGYHLIVDEMHNARSGDSAIGFAAQDLISGAIKTVTLTATTYNGYASGLFYTLYRSSRKFREMFGYHDQGDFVTTHGMTETIETRTTERGTSAGGYNSGQVRTTKREAPGATPGMVASLLPFTATITKKDVAANLPSKTEIRVPVELPENMLSQHNDIKGAMVTARQFLTKEYGFNMGPLSRARTASIGWYDCPVSESITMTDDVAPVKIEGIEGYTPKELTFLELVKENMERGRGLMAFFEQVNKRPAMPRIERLLKENGIESFTLMANDAKPEDRTEWIRARIKRSLKNGQPPVLLTNGNLVAEGVDLLEFPTTVEYGQQYDIIKLQQRLGRAHRLGQTQPVEIYFMHFSETAQSKALILIAAKLRAAYQMEGRPAQGLAEFGDSETFIQELLKRAEKAEDEVLSKLMQTRRFDLGKVRGKRYKSAKVMAEALRVSEFEASQSQLSMF